MDIKVGIRARLVRAAQEIRFQCQQLISHLMLKRCRRLSATLAPRRLPPRLQQVFPLDDFRKADEDAGMSDVR